MDEARTQVVVDTSQLRAERFTVEGAAVLPWQRCQVSERVLVVQQGRGYCYLVTASSEDRREISDGDVIRIPRLVWHRVVALPDEALTATFVTAAPADVERRR